MDPSLALSGIALITSVAALVSSSYLTARQIALLNQANHISPFVQLMAEFRDATFHEKYRYVVSDLQIEHPPELGIGLFELPEPARSAAVDITYYFQNCASFIGHGLLDETRIIAMLHVRFISVWDAIEPYVLAERKRNKTTGNICYAHWSNLQRMQSLKHKSKQLQFCDQAISIQPTDNPHACSSPVATIKPAWYQDFRSTSVNHRSDRLEQAPTGSHYL